MGMHNKLIRNETNMPKGKIRIGDNFKRKVIKNPVKKNLLAGISKGVFDDLSVTQQRKIKEILDLRRGSKLHRIAVAGDEAQRSKLEHKNKINKKPKNKKIKK